MSSHFGKRTAWLAVFSTVFALCLSSGAYGQFGNIQQIGGIAINAKGQLVDADVASMQLLRERVVGLVSQVGDEAKQDAQLRVVSLKGLEAKLADAVQSGATLSDEVLFLAGIQRITHVVADPANNDILICGPGEAWTVDAIGNVVGVKSGRPVMRLEDLIVAIRTASAANEDYGISVSIDPTQEGHTRYAKVRSQVGQAIANGQSFNERMKVALEEALGDHKITLTGLPEGSRMGQILAAADYRMKQYAMGLARPPIALPSVLEMASDAGRSPSSSAPRFWLECAYDSIKRTEDGLTWSIDGPGAKALTENQVIEADGKTRTIKEDRMYTQWAESMSDRFADLADADPIFAELQNVMDMAVAAAIIEKVGMLDTVSLEIPAISGTDTRAELPQWSTPVAVPSQCSFVQLRKEWMVTASGGIQVDSWGVLENVEIDNALASALETANQHRNGTWWNAVTN